jgi:hypothetical protein
MIGQGVQASEYRIMEASEIMRGASFVSGEHAFETLSQNE